jgi:uncharacterized delta-60 repeat protein
MVVTFTDSRTTLLHRTAGQGYARAMRALACVVLLSLSLSALGIPDASLAAPPGALDPAFNGGSPVLLDLAKTVPRSTSLQGVAVDAQSRMVLTGYSTDENGRTAVLIARLGSDGALDATFGEGGSRIVQMGLGSGSPFSVAFDVGPRPAGAGWLIAGYASGSDDRRAALVGAFDANGAVDIGFGNAGSLKPQPGGSPPAETFGNGGGVASDGSSFVACTIETTPLTGANRKLAVVKVTAEGQPAGSFGTQPGAFVGSFSQTTDTGSYGSHPVVTANGILVAGTTLDATGRQQILLVRLTSAGLPDGGFAGGAGFVRAQVADPAASDSQGYRVAVGPSGEIYLAGRAEDSDGRFAFSVTRFTPAGVVDGTFATGGTRRIQTSLGSDDYSNSGASDVVVQSDGKVVLVGSSSNGIDQNQIVALRLDIDGDLDPSFGAGGVARFDVGEAAGAGHAVIVPAGDALLVTGASQSGSVTNGVLARVLLAESSPTTTTTLVPGGCETAPSIVGARCRIGELATMIANGAPDGRLKTRTSKALARAQARLDGAEALSGRKRRTRLKKALALVRRVSRQLDSRLAGRTLADGLRADLLARSDAIVAELVSLLG